MIVTVAALNGLPATPHHLRRATFRLAFEAAEPKVPYICAPLSGTIAQLVEQRIENPCVPGSNPGSTTTNPRFGGGFLFAVVGLSERSQVEKALENETKGYSGSWMQRMDAPTAIEIPDPT